MELYTCLTAQGIAPEAARKMEEYGNAVAEANEKFNLTRILSPEDMAKSHFVDSIDAARKGYFAEAKTVIDIGTGAGFPGVPLAIYLPQVQVTVMDSSEKKTNFIRESCEKLNIPVQVVCGRSEELAREPQYFQKFDIAVARAVARLNVLLELVAPYVKMGGHFLAYKGSSALEEVEEAQSAAEKLGMELVEVVSAGPEDTSHMLAVYRRVKDTPAKLPRKYGKIKKNPL